MMHYQILGQVFYCKLIYTLVFKPCKPLSQIPSILQASDKNKATPEYEMLHVRNVM